VNQLASEPDWVHYAIWWQVYPLGFTGADPTGADRRLAHRLPRVADYLDYAVRLGASGIALGPIFESASHGYDTLDHYRIDPRLGDDADFDQLIAAAHSRGLRVLLDGVFNHVGHDFPAFTRTLAEGPSGAQAGWFVIDWDARTAGEPGYATFEGHSNLVTLDHANPAVVDYVADVMTHWLGRGADGWRLDAAYAVPAHFWSQVLPRVRAAHPNAYLVGEVIRGDYAAIVGETGLDSVTQYELWKAIWSALSDGNLFELSWALQRHNGWLDAFVPLTFVGNHDVTRLASRLPDGRHLPHALVVLFTVGGTPAVYYGDEQGFTGVKEDRAGGDDAVRPAYPADPADLPGDGGPTYRLHQGLIGLRRRHPWLHRAKVTTVLLANEHLVYDTSDGTATLRVLLNLADTELRHDVSGAKALAGNAAVGADSIVIPAHGWAVVELGSVSEGDIGRAGS
jgi:cyclomaltodextrinase / maltogenic alpha-amylase / neopullulanase